jgi:hypothetical protein
MKTAERLSAAILAAAALGIVAGLPLFASLRDAKALQSTAPMCHPTERLSDCLDQLPTV